MFGGVDRDCVFTSAGESGMSAAFFSGLPVKWGEYKRYGGGRRMGGLRLGNDSGKVRGAHVQPITLQQDPSRHCHD